MRPAPAKQYFSLVEAVEIVREMRRQYDGIEIEFVIEPVGKMFYQVIVRKTANADLVAEVE